MFASRKQSAPAIAEVGHRVSRELKDVAATLNAGLTQAWTVARHSQGGMLSSRRSLSVRSHSLCAGGATLRSHRWAPGGYTQAGNAQPTVASVASAPSQSLTGGAKLHAMAPSLPFSRALTHSMRIGKVANNFNKSAMPWLLNQPRGFASAAWSVRQLEVAAQKEPENELKVFEYYKALNKAGYSRGVKANYESRRFVSSDRIYKEYIKAVVNLGQLDHVNLSQSSGGQTFGYGETGANTTANFSLTDVPGNSPMQPLHVTNVVTWGQTLRSLLVRGIFLGALILSFPMIMRATTGSSSGNGIDGILGNAGKKKQAVVPTDEKVGFSDVKGCHEAKQELEEVVEFLKEPHKFTKLGGTQPKGVLLYGPPGTGKTLLARAVAGEAGVPFFHASGSEFEEVFVGLGAKRVRELFAEAKKQAPCVIFIDEIDAVAQSRDFKSVNQSTRQTLNELLTQMDGFDKNSNVMVIGATNYPQGLDKALTRPGRFDKHVHMVLPDVRGRTEIFAHYLEKITHDKESIDANVLARGTPGVSGADIYNIVNSAATHASNMDKDQVTMQDLEWAKDKVLMGPERRSAVLSEEQRKHTAYHEGGHALVALLTPQSMPIHKATIMPRGPSLGMVAFLPEDKLSKTKREMLADMDVGMGGRVAEEIIFGVDNVTSGASNDLEKNTRLAHDMVLRYGLSPVLGNVNYVDSEVKLSGDLQQKADKEVARYLQESYDRAKTLLEAHQKELHLLAEALVKYETLDKSEIDAILRGESLDKILASERREQEEKERKDKEKAQRKGVFAGYL